MRVEFILILLREEFMLMLILPGDMLNSRLLALLRLQHQPARHQPARHQLAQHQLAQLAQVQAQVVHQRVPHYGS